jgi:hypothetical protein
MGPLRDVSGSSRESKTPAKRRGPIRRLPCLEGSISASRVKWLRTGHRNGLILSPAGIRDVSSRFQGIELNL